MSDRCSMSPEPAYQDAKVDMPTFRAQRKCSWWPNQNCSVFSAHFSSFLVHCRQFTSLCSKKCHTYVFKCMHLNFWILYYKHFNFIRAKIMSKLIYSYYPKWVIHKIILVHIHENKKYVFNSPTYVFFWFYGKGKPKVVKEFPLLLTPMNPYLVLNAITLRISVTAERKALCWYE